MLKKVIKSLYNQSSRNLVIFRQFCTENKAQQPDKQQKKSYYIPQQQKQLDIYKPTRKLKFKNGRYLVYLNKQNLLTPFMLDLHYTLPLAYFGYLISTNPFYLTFPAALPMLTILEGIILLRWLSRKSLYKRQVQRVYLLATGIQVQLVYSNKIRRMVKDNQMNSFHFASQFQQLYVQQQKEALVEPTRGMKFPTDPYILRDEAKQPFITQYGWTVRDTQFRNYIIPARYEYADWQILTKIMNGISIDVTDCIQEGEFTRDKIPEVEQEIQNVKKNYEQLMKRKQARKQKQNQSTQKN